MHAPVSSRPAISSNYQFICDLKDWICESAVFAWQFIFNPKTQGTPFALSPFAAKYLIKHLKCSASDGPRLYLEVGPGTGAVTSQLIKKLSPQDNLHLVELDPKLCEVLNKKFENIHNVFIHNSPIETWETSHGRNFDVIVSTVPFNSFSSSVDLSKILNTYQRLIKPEGVISFAEYVGTSTLGRLIRWDSAGKAYDALQKVKSSFFKTHSFEEKVIFANIPPARVIHCKINTSKKQD